MEKLLIKCQLSTNHLSDPLFVKDHQLDVNRVTKALSTRQTVDNQ